MTPVEIWTMSYPKEKMKDGTDVSKRIEINRSKCIANDKRKAKIQESNRRTKRNTSQLERLQQLVPNSRGTDEDTQVTKVDSKGGFFIEDELKIPVSKPNVEKMPGILREVAKSEVSKVTTVTSV